MKRKASPRARHFVKSLHRYLFPHKSNGFKPGIFTVGSAVVLVLGLCAIQACFFFTTYLSGNHSLASVLPSVLENLTNQDRSLNNVGSLTPDALLTKAAEMKAQDMATNGYFAHVSPTGKTPWYWFDQVNYKYTYAGENLAINFTDSTDVENAWMHSPAHRANIVKAQYTRVGIGVAEGTYDGKPAIFVAQLFATPTQSFAQKLSAAGTSTGLIGNASSTSGVLGAQIEKVDDTLGQNAIASTLAQVATSPHHVLVYFLAAAALLILLLLLIAVFIQAKIQYLEVLASGLVLLVAIIGFLVYNLHVLPSGSVPQTTQGASAISAFAR